MISRATAVVIAEAYKSKFSFSGGDRRPALVYGDSLYDFLFENDYEPWFCNGVRKIYSPRDLKEWVMQLHTGETQFAATPNWTWEKRRQLGQHYLKDLGEDVLNLYVNSVDNWNRDTYAKHKGALIAAFELDGYVYREQQLIQSEADVFDVEEEKGILVHLATKLGLARLDVIQGSLKLSEEHYTAQRWADCIANSRKALECILSESAVIFAAAKNFTISAAVVEKPVEVREFLHEKGLLEQKEKEALAKIYGLLSHTGSHPYMAEKDQARLLRQLSLTLAQFVLLRVEGSIK